jgi:hypothetical protein
LVVTNLREQATFGPFVGGTNNNVTSNGAINTQEVLTTGTGTGGPFSITYNPLVGPQSTPVNTGTLNTSTLVFHSTIQPLSYFSSVAMKLDYDFDNDGTFDLTQTYTISLTPVTFGNGLTGVGYSIIPQQNFGSVVINGTTYSFASLVSNSAGSLFDGSTTTAAVQFQFLATPVPEPSTYALAGVVALGGMVLYRRRQAAAGVSEMSV